MLTRDAIDYFGGVTKLAAALGIRREAVYQWRERPPRGRQYQLEVMTDGALTADGKAEREVAIRDCT